MTHDSQSTPITPEGLRGLGMESQDSILWYLNITEDWLLKADMIAGRCEMEYCSRYIGTAPDIETVGRLIEVLRRMNGEGSHDDN